ncbi:MAG: Asp-tRNA(Asn)/Glu-tRNA(Gln) amidotransferase subunit GatC [Magnetococcales bacterium]|nr:Asp-tRNA(Asn)/Glu-tRNA(Gln) amidotransferase subunit GatC [Magnetococcales bacterium]
MSIEPDLVRHVATLARLDIPDDEVAPYADQLSRILDLMGQLNQLDTEAVEPMSHAVDIEIPEREDRVVNSDQRDLLLSGAPDSEQGHFRVPKIIE